jgi:hypothetical protein
MRQGNNLNKATAVSLATFLGEAIREGRPNCRCYRRSRLIKSRHFHRVAKAAENLYLHRISPPEAARRPLLAPLVAFQAHFYDGGKFNKSRNMPQGGALLGSGSL